LECQQCHGEVEKMTVLRQEQPLTMGWCVNCHRETEVQVKDNAYYNDIHKNLTGKGGKYEGSKLTVEMMGGPECARCHY
jgi:hypothetical protein